MNQKAIIDFLREFDTALLPGWDAQQNMSPAYRGEIDLEKILELNPNVGSVAVIIYPKTDELHFVLTQRHDYKGTHGGQISLPGGKKEPDEALFHAAVRECKEELGVELQQDQFCLQLSPIYIPPSHFLVHPFVFYSKEELQFDRDEFEVKEVIEIPLKFLLNEASKIKTEISSSHGVLKNVPAYSFHSKVIWGATAIILSELESILQGVK